MAQDKSVAQQPGMVAEKGYQPLGATARPLAPGAGGVQGGYQPETAQEAPQPPNEGSGVQSPTRKE